MTTDTQNPILEDNPADTVRNVACILSFLQSYTATKKLSEQHLADQDWVGLHAIIGCAEHALTSEIERVRHGNGAHKQS